MTWNFYQNTATVKIEPVDTKLDRELVNILRKVALSTNKYPDGYTLLETWHEKV